MSPIDRDIIQRKTASILENLDELKNIQGKGWKKYQTDRILRKATEKILQETIEAACDIAAQVVVGKGHAAPQDYRSCFLDLSKFGIISAVLAKDLAPSTGLRNRLVHEYQEIDNKKVFESIADVLRLFPKFLSLIQKKT